MPSAACATPRTCLARRDEVFRRDAIWTRDHECTSCVIGTARRMDSFTPDPETRPSHFRRGTRACPECGEPMDLRNKGGCCRACRSLIYGDHP
jgi:hypothetical protein